MRTQGEAAVVPAPVADLVALFASELGDVHFPDVDAEALKSLVEQVEERSATVDEAEAAVEQARTAAATAQEELVQAAERALAYARVYASGRPNLEARLAKITFGKGARRPLEKSGKSGKAGARRKKNGSSEEASQESPPATETA